MSTTLLGILFFILAFATLVTMFWAGLQLFQEQEDPLSDRLTELQAHAIVGTTRGPKRKAGGGFLNSVLYFISLIPGGEEWIRDTEKELAQAGIRNRQALGTYALGQLLFFVFIVAGMGYAGRENPIIQRLGGLLAACLLGYLLPPQVLHRLVARYRKKLIEALPDTVDLLGIVLGIALAPYHAMLRVSED